MKAKDMVFFNIFKESAENLISICNMLENLDKTEVEKNLKKIYAATEKEKINQKKYFNLLEKAFITPVDRDLLFETGRKFAEFTEAVKDIAASVYYTGIYEKRNEDNAFHMILKKMCERVNFLSKEIGNYKNTEKLKEISAEIREIEMEGERLYVRFMKKLFLEEKDTKKLVCYQKINALYLKSFNAGGNIARQTEKLILS